MPYQTLSSHYHLPRLTEYPRLLWSHGLGTFGSSLATIFIPIFLVKEMGLSIQHVLAWYLVFVVTAIPFLYVGARMASRFGSKKEIALGHLLHAASYVSILFITDSRECMIWISAFLLAATRGIYWPAYHAYFSKIKRPEKSGEQIGLAIAIGLLAHGLAPAIGGIVADLFGVSFLYGAGLTILIMATLPMINGPEVTKKRPFNLRLLDLKKVKGDLIANSAYSTSVMVEVLVWPLLVFLIVGSYSAVGVLSSVVLIATILTAIYVGKLEKTRGEKHFLKEGVFTVELSHLLRFIASTPPAIFVVNSVFGIAKALKTTPFITRYYKMADEEPRMEYIFAFEVAHQVGHIIILVPLVLAGFFLSGETLLLLGIALIMPLGVMTMKIR